MIERNGRAVTLDDREWFESGRDHYLFRHFSERAFANIYLYRAVHRYRRVDEPLPHITGITYDGTRCIIPLFAPDLACPQVMTQLLGHGCLYPIDQGMAEALPVKFESKVNLDDSDYIFNRAAIAELEGLGERRRQASRFEQDRQPRTQDIADDHQADAVNVLEGWLADVGRPVDSTDFAACGEALTHRHALSLFGLMVYEASGAPLGFLLASQIADDMAVIHFAKGRRHAQGVFPYMFRVFARRWPEYTFINFEQDLGKAGFRQAKRAYRPVRLLDKLRLFLAD